MKKFHFFEPKTIYTRLKDLFEAEEDNKNNNENKDTNNDFSSDNFVKPKFIGDIMQQRKKRFEKLKKEQNEKIIEPKYVNKNLVESYLNAIKQSK